MDNSISIFSSTIQSGNMKKLQTTTAIIILISALLYTAFAMGQEQQQTRYLLEGKDIRISGFGGPVLAVSQVSGDAALFTGGGGAVLINRSFYIGGFGEGLTSRHTLPLLSVMNSAGDVTDYYDLRTDFGYGGLWAGYIFHPEKAVHAAVSSRIGLGSLSLTEDDYHIDRYDNIMEDMVFVFSPQVELEVNLFRWFRINAGAGYRFTGGIEKQYRNPQGNLEDYFTSKDFSGPQFSLGLLFGGFDN